MCRDGDRTHETLKLSTLMFTR
uniref:Uncharacterized protein n=1 Tax=Arundo donax TaxID=35708 RepID=A0A0A9C623_ARUDO